VEALLENGGNMESNALNKEKTTNLFSTNTLARASMLLALSVILKIIFEIYIPLAGLPALRINITSIPIILSGMMFGPLVGFIVGGLSDILCFIIKPSGPYFPGFTIAAALTGLIPGLIFKYIKKDRRYTLINTIIIIAISLGFIGMLFVKDVLEYSNETLYIYNNPLNIIHIILYVSLIFLYIYIPYRISKEENNLKIDKILFAVSITQLVTSVMFNTYFLSILFGKGFMIFLPGRIITNFVLIPLYTIILAATYKLIKTSKYN